MLTDMVAFVFPGQGAQYPGMGRDLYERFPQARDLFEEANDVLGFRISDIMFEGSDDDLLRTSIAQPAIFIHSVIACRMFSQRIQPAVLAGHSLGEYSALVVSGALSFSAGLRLVVDRANAMQSACKNQIGGMAAVIGLEDSIVEHVCRQLGSGIVPANYNCPGQVVISGPLDVLEQACDALLEAGARRALPLPVNGAFHSMLMQSAAERLFTSIDSAIFSVPKCPIVQNVDARPHLTIAELKGNLKKQLTAPVRWTDTVRNMASMGITTAYEFGPGCVLCGLIKKTDKSINIIKIESEI